MSLRIALHLEKDWGDFGGWLDDWDSPNFKRAAGGHSVLCPPPRPAHSDSVPVLSES